MTVRVSVVSGGLWDLYSYGRVGENKVMEISGRIHNGVVVFDNDPSLPEGLEVTIVCPQIASTHDADAHGNVPKRRIELPLVHCDKPGSVHLTNERIAEILDAEDAAPRR